MRSSTASLSTRSSRPQLDHRYLHEDVGWGLVPWMNLAAAADSPAPIITVLTHPAGMINGIDYPREGLTLERMGLAGKTLSEIRAHVGAPAAEAADPFAFMSRLVGRGARPAAARDGGCVKLPL